MIRLADRSEFVWAVVSEYEADVLASDSDDEKRIDKAEKAAECKSLKRKRQRGAARPITRRGTAWSRPPLSLQAQLAPPTKVLPVIGRGAPALAAQYQQCGLGPCFACGDFGHLRRSCTKVAGPGTLGKWYPHNDLTAGVNHGSTG